jgi:PIN like domain
MRIIIDECVPSLVKKSLPEREIVSVQDMGWAGIKNGRLLQLVAELFDVFVTSDKNIRHQQNLASFAVSILVLPSNQVPVIRELLPEIDEALGDCEPGGFLEL